MTEESSSASLEPILYDLTRAKSLVENTLRLSDVKSTKIESELYYLAPEMYEKGKQPLQGDKIDVFAMGVILFFVIFGRPPFSDAK